MNLGILLWNTCNALCDHCAVNSGPKEKSVMSNEEIFRIIDSAFYDCERPSIGLSGGEAFVYFDRLCEIVNYASTKGAFVCVNTNAYWGKTIKKAEEYIKKIKKLGLRKMVVSTDDFHTPYVDEECVINVIQSCLKLHLEVDIQYVSSKKTARLHEFLERHGDSILNISVREIPVHPVGRAEKLIPIEDFQGSKRIPSGLCPSAIPSISAKGKVIPCCNTAGHLPTLELGDARSDNLPLLYEDFKSDPLFYVLRNKGPGVLHETAKKVGMQDPACGYIDQCHLCHQIFKDEKTANASREEALKLANTDAYNNFLNSFESNYLKSSSTT